jgi:hypothetical protein
MGFLRDDLYSKTGLRFESMASVQFQLKFFRKPGVNVLWNNTDKLTVMEQIN